MCDIIKYDFIKKQFSKVKLPDLKNFGVTTDYTISPDEKIIIFNNIYDGKRNMYIIDKGNNRIIDTVPSPQYGNAAPQFDYSWKSDSSYVIFTMDNKEILKYTIPKHY